MEIPRLAYFSRGCATSIYLIMDGLSSVAGIAEVIGFYFAEFFCDVGLGDFHAAVAPVHGQNPSTYGGYLDLSFHVAVGIGMAVTSNCRIAGYECHSPQLLNLPVDQMAYMLRRCRC